MSASWFENVNLDESSGDAGSISIEDAARGIDADAPLPNMLKFDACPIGECDNIRSVALGTGAASNFDLPAVNKEQQGQIGNNGGQFSECGRSVRRRCGHGISSQDDLIRAGWDPNGSAVQVVDGCLVVNARRVELKCEPSLAPEGEYGGLRISVLERTEDGLATRVAFESVAPDGPATEGGEEDSHGG